MLCIFKIIFTKNIYVKKISLLTAFICVLITANAQIDSSAKNFAKYATVPTFNVYTVPDSSGFSNKKLDKSKSLVIMFFSPDCEHCQKETKELMAYKNELKNIQILMVSPSSYPAIKQFYEDYGMAAMPNIKLGQDVNYTLGSIYQIRTFPSMYVYDHNGKLVKAFVGNVDAPAIINAVK